MDPTSSGSVAVVEDHADLAASIVDVLVDAGWDARAFPSAETFRHALATFTPDVAVVDLNLPGEDGVSLTQFLRSAQPRMGIVMLTARTSELDRRVGYEAGADVYVAKPARPDELTTIVGRMLERLRGGAGPRGVEAPYRLDVERLVLVGPDGTEVPLLPREASLLQRLAEAGASGLTSEAIRELEPGASVSKGSIEVRITRLREKLGGAGLSRRLVVAIRGVGYRLAERVVVSDPAPGGPSALRDPNQTDDN